MNTVHLVGDIGDKFGHEWNMNVSDYGEIVRLIECQREGFKQYLIESEENEIGFTIQRAGEYINDEQELLLNLNEEETEIIKGLYGTPELITISKVIGPEVTKALSDAMNSISGNTVEKKRGLAART